MHLRRTIGYFVLSLTAVFFLSACGGGGGDSAPPPPPDLSPAATTVPASSVTINSAVLNAVVNPKGLSTTAWFEYSKDPGLANVTSTTPQALGAGSTDNAITQAISGLESGQTYYFRVTAINSAGTKNGAIFTLSTLPLPTVTTNPATSITTSGAVLNGTVDPNGLPTSAWFEYGETQALGTPIDNQLRGSGTDNVPISTTLTGLKVATVYYFRVVAANSSGTSNGTILSFTTAGGVPTVATQQATSVTAHGAVLNGTVNPSALPTNSWFEYGIPPLMGTVVDNQVQGSGTITLQDNATLVNLLLNTQYQYRIVASNSVGTSFGDTFSFTTLNPPPVANAGPDQTVYHKGASGDTVATLDGSASTSGDPAKTIASYSWVQTAGTAVALDNAASPTPTFTAPAKFYGESENLQFQLTVTDNTNLASAPDNVVVTATWGFLDDFSSDTIGTYSVVSSPAGGTLTYDSASERALVTTGSSRNVFISHTFGLAPLSSSGIFSLDMLPITKFSSAGFVVTLGESAGTFYEISTLTGTVTKYVASTPVETQPFTPTYSAGVTYPIRISFTSSGADIEIFGQTVNLTVDGKIDAFYFGVNTFNQNTYYDNFKLESLP